MLLKIDDHQVETSYHHRYSGHQPGITEERYLNILFYHPINHTLS